MTAGHVVPGAQDVFYRIPLKNGSVHHIPHAIIQRATGMPWIWSTNSDLALTMLMFIGPEDQLAVRAIDVISLGAKYDEVEVGDDVFVVGYPSSVIQISKHIARLGMIASKLGDAQLLVDAVTFPGNSGGPVFWKPSMGLKGDGTIKFSSELLGRPSKLVGIVKGYLPFQEQAVSPMTQRTRITFEENSGLTLVTSTTRILELLQNTNVVAAIQRTGAANTPSPATGK